MGSRISSCAARLSGPLPSHLSVTCKNRLDSGADRPTRRASISATSQWAVMCGLSPRAALGARRAISSAARGGELPGGGSARSTPSMLWSWEPYITGRWCRVMPPAEDLRPELRVRRAAGVEEQARVVGVPARLDVEPEALAQPGGEDRGLETVLERQAHTEVGRQAEGADHLSGPDAFWHWRDLNPVGRVADQALNLVTRMSYPRSTRRSASGRRRRWRSANGRSGRAAINNSGDGKIDSMRPARASSTVAR